MEEYMQRLTGKHGPPPEPGEEMKFEEFRFGSFDSWPDSASQRPRELAAAGFFFDGPPTDTKCYFCKGVIKLWETGERPLMKHVQKFPNCSFVKGFLDLSNPFHNKSAPESGASNGHPETLPNGNIDEEMETGNNMAGAANGTESAPGLSQITMITQNLKLGEEEQSQAEEMNGASESSPAVEQPPDPDNMLWEINRLATFNKDSWPASNCPISSRVLARNGFYYLGTKDRVKCTFCGGVLRNWSPDDDVKEEHRKHFAHCGYVRGSDVGNVSIPESKRARASTQHRQPDFSNMLWEVNRQATFKNPWPASCPVSYLVLARCGFYYLGARDRVKCTFCGGILKNWDHGDDVEQEHKKNFPNCGFVRGLDVGNVHIKARNPEYALHRARLATFRNWPHAAVSVEDLAEAGLFYAGFADVTKCFFCDGRLRNWDPKDKPWFEHARCFPHCGFVRSEKGKDYVNYVLEQVKYVNEGGHQNPEPMEQNGVL